MDTSALDQQVTEALKQMNDIMGQIGHDLNETMPPIPIVDPVTPVITASTIETSKVYETLLESDSTFSSSLENNLSLTSASRSSPLSMGQIFTKEQFDLEHKLNNWRSIHSKSLPSFPSTNLRNTNHGRNAFSAPPSPQRQYRNERSLFDTTAKTNEVRPPASFSYHSFSTSDLPNNIEDQQSTNATRRILEFLAQKVDLLSVSINTIQYNLSKISETFNMTIAEKIQGNNDSIEQSITDKINYLEEKFDNFRSVIGKDYHDLKSENIQLKEKPRQLYIEGSRSRGQNQ